MTRLAALLAMLLLVGCGLLQVGDRAIPSAPGAVAVTAWQTQEPDLPRDLADVTGTTARDYLERLAAVIRRQSVGTGEVRHGILSEDGSSAIGYVQVLPPAEPGSSIVAMEARLTLARAVDGSWGLAGLETREQCAEQLTGTACGDSSRG